MTLRAAAKRNRGTARLPSGSVGRTRSFPDVPPSGRSRKLINRFLCRELAATDLDFRIARLVERQWGCATARKRWNFPRSNPRRFFFLRTRYGRPRYGVQVYAQSGRRVGESLRQMCGGPDQGLNPAAEELKGGHIRENGQVWGRAAFFATGYRFTLEAARGFGVVLTYLRGYGRGDGRAGVAKGP